MQQHAALLRCHAARIGCTAAGFSQPLSHACLNLHRLPCVCSLTVRSVCIKNVHPAASERVLIAHFGACGFIERITFLR